MQDSVHTAQLRVIRKTGKMHYTKIGWLIADIIGIPTTLYGFWLNVDNIKSSIIALLVIVYLSLRIYYYRSEKEQKKRGEEYRLWHEEMDKQERIDKWDKYKRSTSN